MAAAVAASLVMRAAAMLAVAQKVEAAAAEEAGPAMVTPVSLGPVWPAALVAIAVRVTHRLLATAAVPRHWSAALAPSLRTRRVCLR